MNMLLKFSFLSFHSKKSLQLWIHFIWWCHCSEKNYNHCCRNNYIAAPIMKIITTHRKVNSVVFIYYSAQNSTIMDCEIWQAQSSPLNDLVSIIKIYKMLLSIFFYNNSIHFYKLTKDIKQNKTEITRKTEQYKNDSLLFLHKK